VTFASVTTKPPLPSFAKVKVPVRLWPPTTSETSSPVKVSTPSATRSSPENWLWPVWLNSTRAVPESVTPGMPTTEIVPEPTNALPVAFEIVRNDASVR